MKRHCFRCVVYRIWFDACCWLQALLDWFDSVQKTTIIFPLCFFWTSFQSDAFKWWQNFMWLNVMLFGYVSQFLLYIYLKYHLSVVVFEYCHAIHQNNFFLLIFFKFLFFGKDYFMTITLGYEGIYWYNSLIWPIISCIYESLSFFFFF